MEKTYYLPAEWHKQSYIQLTWPHNETDLEEDGERI